MAAAAGAGPGSLGARCFARWMAGVQHLLSHLLPMWDVRAHSAMVLSLFIFLVSLGLALGSYLVYHFTLNCPFCLASIIQQSSFFIFKWFRSWCTRSPGIIFQSCFFVCCSIFCRRSTFVSSTQSFDNAIKYFFGQLSHFSIPRFLLDFYWFHITPENVLCLHLF